MDAQKYAHKQEVFKQSKKLSVKTGPGLIHSVLDVKFGMLSISTFQDRVFSSSVDCCNLPFNAVTKLKKMGFPGGKVVKNPPACHCKRHRRCRFSPWFWKIPWRRAWQLTPVFLSGKFHGQRSLLGYSAWNHKESDTTETRQSILYISCKVYTLRSQIVNKLKYMCIKHH